MRGGAGGDRRMRRAKEKQGQPVRDEETPYCLDLSLHCLLPCAPLATEVRELERKLEAATRKCGVVEEQLAQLQEANETLIAERKVRDCAGARVVCTLLLPLQYNLTRQVLAAVSLSQVSEGQLIQTLRREVEAIEAVLEEERSAHVETRKAAAAREHALEASLQDGGASLARMQVRLTGGPLERVCERRDSSAAVQGVQPGRQLGSWPSTHKSYLSPAPPLLHIPPSLPISPHTLQRDLEARSAKLAAVEERCHALEHEVDGLAHQLKTAEGKVAMQVGLRDSQTSSVKCRCGGWDGAVCKCAGSRGLSGIEPMSAMCATSKAS